MRKFFQNGSAYLLAALVFLIAAGNADRPGVFLVMGIVFIILGFAARKNFTDKRTGDVKKE